MSLFKAREWWTASTGSNEEFAPTAFCVGDVDNQGDDKIVTGSLSGLLRIYHPRQRDYRADDLLLEQQLGAPIIQLVIGKLLTGSTRLALAVLHPRKLVIYEVHGAGQGGSYHTLARALEHSLDRNCFNMTLCEGSSAAQARSGSGGASIAVQSIDGTVSIFESDTFSFARLLDGFLIPGPWVYAPRADAFFTGNSQFEVQCFKMASLALASADAPAAGAAGADAKKAPADWSVVVGEQVIELKLGRFTRGLPLGGSDVIVLCAHTLFVLKLEGAAIKYQRRLDMQPSCMAVYAAGEMADPTTGGPDNVILCSASGALQILREGVLLWSARTTTQVPITLAVASFAKIKGLVASMSECGDVQISYLGTDPPTNAVGGSHERDLNYEEMDAEHRTILARIRDATSGKRAEPADYLMLRAQVPRGLDPRSSRALGYGDYDDGEAGDEGAAATVRISVAYTGKGCVEQASLAISCTPPFYATRTSIELGAVAGGASTPLSVPVLFKAKADVLPTSTTAVVIATFVTPEGEPRTARCEFELPLALVAHVVPPVKASTFKITLDTDQPAAPLADLFDDFAAMAAAAGEPLKAAATVLSLRYTCGFDVSILLSKNAGRYRLQCGAFEPLCLVAHELCARLRRAMPAVVVGFSEPLPLHELFELVDAHLASRAAVAALNRELEERATQFRAIQKRLLVRFKDRNPAPLANLDLLLRGTHAQLMELADRVGRAHAARDTAATSLSSAVQLINLLIALRFRLDDDNRVALAAHLSPRVHSLSEQGWEERTDAALTHALRTSLGKGGAAAAGALAPPAFSVPTDASKLKKHITVMCDRISKGARFK